MPAQDNYQVSIDLSVRNRGTTALNNVSNSLRTTSREAQRATSSIQDMDARFQSMQNLFGTAVLGVSIAGVGRFAQEMVDTGREVQRSSALFQSFSSSIGDTSRMMETLRSASRGVVSDFNLMQGANQLLSMGLATNADELARITEISATFAQAMGRDVGDSLNQMAMILANQSYERLDSLGISSGEVRRIAAQYRDAGMESSEAFNRAFLEIAEGMLPRMSVIADRAVSSIDRLETKLRNLYEVASSNFATGVVAIADLAEAAANYEPGRQADIAQQMADLQSIVMTRAMNSLGPGAIMMPDNAEWIEATVRNIIDQSTTGNPYDLSDVNLPVTLWNQAGMGSPEDNVDRVNAIRAAVNAMRDYYAISRSVAGSQSELETVMADSADALADYARQADNAAAYQRIMTQEMADTARAVPMFQAQLEAAQNQQASFSAFEAAYANFNTSAALGFGDVANAEELQTFYQRWAELDSSIRNTRDVFGELLPDDINARLTDAADSMRLWMERAQAARDAYDDMTLDVALLRGQDVDELAAGIAGGLDFSGLDDEARQEYMDAIGLLTGQESQSGIAFRGQLAEIQSLIDRGVEPAIVTSSIERLETLIREMRTMGLTDAEMANALEQPVGLAAWELGIPLVDSSAEYLQNMRDSQNTAVIIDGTMASLPTYGEELRTSLDTAFSTRRTLTIDLDVNASSIRGELADLIRSIVASNNGQTPGSTSLQGRSTRGRTGPVP